MKKRIILLIFLASVPCAAFAASKQQPASYRYNRISMDFSVQANGSVVAQELLTMLYSGTYHSMWRAIPLATSTTLSDVKVADGSTGQAFSYVPSRLDGSDPNSWGKYTTYVQNGAENIEWYYNTSDHVHTWALTYVTHGAIAFYDDHDEFFWNEFSGFDVPVDTVETVAHLPAPVTLPQSNIFTTGGHDYYIDRPDQKTFRFRVSDIGQGERVSIKVDWQKGIVHPEVAVPFAMQPRVRLALAGAIALVLFGVLVFLSKPTRKFFAGLYTLVYSKVYGHKNSN